MNVIKRSFGLKRANTPAKNDKGYASGKITHITFEKEELVTKDKEGADTVDVERVIFHFDVDGTSGEPIKIKHKCGVRLNGEKYVVKGKGRGKDEKKEYNKLTKTCLQLGFITEAELKNLTDAVMDRVTDKMDHTKDLCVTFKPTLDQKNNLFGIGMSTLEVKSGIAGKITSDKYLKV